MATKKGALWSALKKSWLSFTIMKNKKYVHSKSKKLRQIARRIQHLQGKLGLEISDFSDIGIKKK